MRSSSISALILAAGASSRLGQPKQMLPWKSSTLLGHSITAAQTVVESVYVVLGAFYEETLPEVQKWKAQPILNKDWQKGISTSIRCGVEVAFCQPEIQAVLILLCDQPSITEEHLQNLIHLYHPIQSPITASFYAGSHGVPAIFDRSFMQGLLSLQGDKGAKSLLEKYHSLVKAIAMDEGEVDIDSPEDWEKYKGF
jgi:molybdenum cofactor cytidylyltransferase